MFMRILITEDQVEFLKKNKENSENYQSCGRKGSTQIHTEDKILFKKFYDRFGFLPFYRHIRRLGNDLMVGDVYPTHPMAHKSFYGFYLCKSKVYGKIKDEMQLELGLYIDKGGTKNYITMDDKYFLRSIFEVIFYNIFYINKAENKLEVDSRKFYGECGEINKEVDFIYNNETVIEIAGMDKSDYYEKLNRSMNCIKVLGYRPIIYNVREMEKRKLYSKFYEQVCKDFNFPIDEDIINSPYMLFGHKNLSTDIMKKFIDNNIKTATQISDRKTYEKLNRYLKQLYNKSVREYRKEIGVKQKNK